MPDTLPARRCQPALQLGPHRPDRRSHHRNPRNPSHTGRHTEYRPAQPPRPLYRHGDDDACVRDARSPPTDKEPWEKSWKGKRNSHSNQEMPHYRMPLGLHWAVPPKTRHSFPQCPKAERRETPSKERPELVPEAAKTNIRQARTARIGNRIVERPASADSPDHF